MLSESLQALVFGRRLRANVAALPLSSLLPLAPSHVFSSCSTVWSKHAGKHEVSTAPRSEATFPETFLDKTETRSANRHMKWSRKYADGEFAFRSFFFFFKILLNVYLYIGMCNGCPYAGPQEYKPSAVIISLFFFFFLRT